MPPLTPLADLADLAELADRPRAAETPLVVVALCAAWCGTCRDFRPAFERIANARPGIVFAWADIEDDAEFVGDIDVDNFPTLAVMRAGVVLHFGVTLPHEAVVARLIDALSGAPLRPAPGVPDEVRALAAQLSR
ncbi:thioredoxin family protein [Thauera aromatica]|uniref:thioredoxin family protein n=1 Tax=Thauera aromatica TaxID=59405 RepID=UPI001FFD7178|nr:thioredoxin family protein [Thauera aromatica]MCK2094662.1 thioredoxin family protein [Thauera aromatica]